MDTSSIVLTGIGYVVYFVIMAGAPVIQKKTIKSAGNKVFPFPKFDKVRSVLLYITSFAVIGLSLIPRFSVLIKVIFELCGIMGVYITSKERIFTIISGLYEKGFICPDGFISFDDILTLPILNLPIEEQQNYSNCSIVIATKSKGNIEIFLDDEEKCNKVKSELFNLCPRLKPEN